MDAIVLFTVKVINFKFSCIQLKVNGFIDF